MTQDERWQQQYEQVLTFMNANHRRPSKHRIEEHLMLNWIKHNKRLYVQGSLPADRMEKFARLMSVADCYRRVNQWDVYQEPALF